MFTNRVRTIAIALTALTTAAALAQNYDLSWNTMDGGGATFSSGGAFSLGATIGQPDAGPSNGPMTGGAFTLVGGFWPAAASAVCACPGDTNGDGQKNGLDIQFMVECVLFGGSCPCAELDGAAGLTPADLQVFVSNLIAGAVCP